MGIDMETGRRLQPAEISEISGHISLPGRADLADCLYNPNGASVDDFEAAIGKVTSVMTDSQAARFGRIVVAAIEAE
jgi:hypothetical protein